MYITDDDNIYKHLSKLFVDISFAISVMRSNCCIGERYYFEETEVYKCTQCNLFYI